MKKGFTLVETIAVVAILGMLVMLAYLYLKPKQQIAKGQDGQRKSDLNMISKALEDCLNDNPCYPEESVFQNCGGNELQPYLRKIPCDPQTKQPYFYQRPDCSKYVIYANLAMENQNITYSNNGNYVVSSSSLRLIPTIIEAGSQREDGEVEPTSIPLTSTPFPTSASGIYYGCFSGDCQRLSSKLDCQPNYGDDDCYDQCGSTGNPTNECQ